MEQKKLIGIGVLLILDERDDYIWEKKQLVILYQRDDLGNC